MADIVELARNLSVDSNLEDPILPFTPCVSFNGSNYTNLSDLDLAISLEFLSCSQSDQIIPIQTICDVILPAFLHYLSKGNRSLTNVYDQNNSSAMSALFLKIQKEIREAKENFERLKKWEKNLDERVHDLLELDWDWEGKVNAGTEGNAEALRKIGEMVRDLKQHIDPPCNAIPIIEPIDGQGQSSSFGISRDEGESAEQSIYFTISFGEFKERYDSLNHDLKKCLLYFSAFPADSKIRKKALTYLWIGEGFIDPTTTENLNSEEISEIYFNELVRKGLIEPVGEKVKGDFNSCKMNSYIHSFVVQLAKESDFFDFDARDKPTTDYIRSRRACISKEEDRSVWSLVKRFDDSNSEKLFTLFNLDETFPGFPRNWFSKMNKLSTLHLGSWRSSNRTSFLVKNTEFLRDLHSKNLLRCLSLNTIYKIRNLPGSIRELVNLRILDLKACYDLRELPDAIGSLQSLTHLDMSECYLINYMPKGLSMLVNLLVLKGFVISGDPTSQMECTLADLVKLEKLRKLSIYTNKNVTGNEGQFNSLSQFKEIQVLTMSWTRVTPRAPLAVRTKKHDNAEVITPSSLPASLQKLDLRGWPLREMPCWANPLELLKLNKLYIKGGGLCDISQEMYHNCQWTVKILRLEYLKELEMNWQEARLLFPRLVYLNKVDCPVLVSFPADGEWRPDNDILLGSIHGAKNV